MFSRVPRAGFTKIEFVAVLFMIAILTAVILPAMRSSRNIHRRNHCLNSMRNVGLAMQNHASQNAGKLPLLERRGADDAYRNTTWPRELLRLLDQPDLDRKISAGDALTDADLTIKVLTCPQDEEAYRQPGGLSYVVNGGFGFFPVDPQTGVIHERGRHSLAQDWNGNATSDKSDRLITRATGLIWRPSDAVQQMTLDEISDADGMGHTLMLTESLHAGPWTSHDVRGLAFVVDRNRMTFDRQFGPLAVTKVDLGPFAINKAPDLPVPAPTPSSNHPGRVHAIWADGRGTSLSEEIDPLVYVRLLTPAGSRYGEPALGNDPLGGEASP